MPINHRALGRTEGKPEGNPEGNPKMDNIPQMSYLANYKPFPDFVQVSTCLLVIERPLTDCYINTFSISFSLQNYKHATTNS